MAVSGASDTLEMRQQIHNIWQERWIAYPRAVAAIQMVQDILDHPKTARMPCLLIHGGSGMGKTMIAHKLQRMYPSTYDAESGVTQQKVVYMVSPPEPVELDFYLSILSAIDAPYSPSIRPSVARKQVLRHLGTLQCQGLLIDDINNTLSGTGRQQRVFLNALRYISHTAQVSLICFGLDSAERAISLDEQLAERFQSYPLPRWKCDSQLEKLITALINQFKLKNPSSITTKACLREIITQTNGNLGRIIRLLQDAAVYAIRDKTEAITLATIKKQSRQPPLISMVMK